MITPVPRLKNAISPSLQSLHILPPIMRVLESQHLADLPIAQRRLVLAHLPRELGVRNLLGQELRGRDVAHGDGVVGRVEDLEAQAVLFDAQVADLAEVAGVDVRPGVAFAGRGFREVGGEVAGICMGEGKVS